MRSSSASASSRTRGAPAPGAGFSPSLVPPRCRCQGHAPYTPRVTATATSVDEPDQLERRRPRPIAAGPSGARLVPAAAAALSGVLLYVELPAAHPVVAGAARLRRPRLVAARPHLEGRPSARLSRRARLPAAAAGVDRRGGRPGAVARRSSRSRRSIVALVGAGIAARVRLPAWPVWAAARVDRRRGGPRPCAVRRLPLGQDRLRPGRRRLPAARRGGRHSRAGLRRRAVRFRAVRGRPSGRRAAGAPVSCSAGPPPRRC